MLRLHIGPVCVMGSASWPAYQDHNDINIDDVPAICFQSRLNLGVRMWHCGAFVMCDVTWHARCRCCWSKRDWNGPGQQLMLPVPLRRLPSQPQQLSLKFRERSAAKSFATLPIRCAFPSRRPARPVRLRALAPRALLPMAQCP